MASIKGTQTEKNLLTAFAGESQARMRYTMFAKQAKKEGFEQIWVYLWKPQSKKKNMLNVSSNFWKAEW